MLNRRQFLGAAGISAAAMPMLASTKPATVVVDLKKTTGDFPHYWENVVGSDRIAVALREQWQRDLVRARNLTGIRSVRCHGLFNDEMGVCNGVGPRGLQLSFLYVSQIYDKLLDLGVRPFVELSFMPTSLASSRNSIFFYKGNVSPPRNLEHWGELVKAFTTHCVKRYGINEVSQWQFECWNEPNIAFWAGTQDEYFELYRQTANATKSVSKRIRIGGPATAQVAWIPEFLSYCARREAPVDFVTTHIYPDDPQENIFGRPNVYRSDKLMPRAMARVRDQILSSKRDLPLLITEWTSQNPAFIGQAIRDCSGLAETMSYWTFNNVFEEFGPTTRFFNSSFGMIGHRGINRPSLHAFTMLHSLGNVRLWSSDGPVLGTKRADGSCALIAWNTSTLNDGRRAGSDADELAMARAAMSSGVPMNVTLKFLGGAAGRHARVTMIDMLRGSALPAWEAMGCPPDPTADEVRKLSESACMPAAEMRPIDGDQLSLVLQPTALALIEIEQGEARH